jgi:hypothetical protein
MTFEGLGEVFEGDSTVCRKISTSVDGGGKRRVPRAQTTERGPPSALVEIGPSGVRALPLAAGINEGGHYFRY